MQNDSWGTTIKIAVGLGNPGARYRGTRHNIGFEVLQELARQQSAPPSTVKFEGELTSCHVDGTKLIVIQPQTYMNLSGRCVAAVTQFYKIDVEQDLLVVCDDISLPLGKLRIRAQGSAGGQKGLNNILKVLGTQSIARLRIGVDHPPPCWDAADFVLSRFKRDERESIDSAIQSACHAILDWCKHDLAYCMNQYN